MKFVGQATDDKFEGDMRNIFLYTWIAVWHTPGLVVQEAFNSARWGVA